MADTELEVLDEIVDVLGGTSGQYETVVPALRQIKELLGGESIPNAVDAWLDEHPEATTTVQDGSITGPKIADNTIPDAKLAQTGGVLSATKDMRLQAGEMLSATKPPTAATNFRTLEGLTLHKGCAYELTSTLSSDASATGWNLRDANGTQIATFSTVKPNTTEQAGFSATDDVSGAYVNHWGNSSAGTFTDTIRLVYDKQEIAKGSTQAAMASMTGYNITLNAGDFFRGNFNTTGYVGGETKRIVTAPMIVKKGTVINIAAGTNGLYVIVLVFGIDDDDGEIVFSPMLTASAWISDGSYTVPYDGYIVIGAANAATFGDSTAIVPSDFDSTVTISRPYAAGAVTVQNVLEQSFNSAYHIGATDFATKCQQFSTLMYGDTMGDVDAPSDIESFLFFTDPHLAESSGWENLCMEFIAQIQKYYNSTPTSFCLCGGDWLGNNDLPAEACFKMGYIDGFMHSMFDNCYMLVGNHDTNYQGKLTPESETWTTRLSDQSIRDLWYRGGNAYYEFMGASTRFFCFDTGIEAQALSANDNYGYEQANWFASKLLTNTVEHIALAAHILYYDSSNNMQPLTQLVLSIAQEFNTRGSISVDGTPYNFSECTGTVEFLIAGHMHSDGTATISGIPCIMTTWVRDNESYGPTFDLVLVDYDAGEIKTVRVGDGSDRTISLASA